MSKLISFYTYRYIFNVKMTILVCHYDQQLRSVWHLCTKQNRHDFLTSAFGRYCKIILVFNFYLLILFCKVICRVKQIHWDYFLFVCKTAYIKGVIKSVAHRGGEVWGLPPPPQSIRYQISSDAILDILAHRSKRLDIKLQ